jgi:hypothetical protein
MGLIRTESQVLNSLKIKYRVPSVAYPPDDPDFGFEPF